jgi:hypothetical protein
VRPLLARQSVRDIRGRDRSFECRVLPCLPGPVGAIRRSGRVALKERLIQAVTASALGDNV